MIPPYTHQALRDEIKPDVLLEPVDIIAKYRKVAEQGDAEAQLNLGWEYHIGKFVPKDNAEALDWWHKSADQGCVAAQNSLGWAYSVAVEYGLAYFWLALATRHPTLVLKSFIIYLLQTRSLLALL